MALSWESPGHLLTSSLPFFMDSSQNIPSPDPADPTHPDDPCSPLDSSPRLIPKSTTEVVVPHPLTKPSEPGKIDQAHPTVDTPTTFLINSPISTASPPTPSTTTPYLSTTLPSAVTSSSSIITLEPYCPPSSQTFSKSFTPSSHSVTYSHSSSSRPRYGATLSRTSFNTLFGPQKWNRFFVIPANAPYADNTLKFQQCLQSQVGKLPFHTQLDGSRIIRAETQAQATALSKLCDLESHPFPLHNDTPLNQCIGTVAVPSHICPKTIAWSSCNDDILALLKDEYDAINVTCYTLPARGRRKFATSIAKIAFHRHDIPSTVYLGGELLPVKPYRPPPRQCQNCWRFGHPEKHCRSSPRCPLCAKSDHTRLDCQAQTRNCANCSGPHNVFYKGCPTYKFEAEVAVIRHTHGLPLRAARAEARRQGFKPIPTSRLISQPTPPPLLPTPPPLMSLSTPQSIPLTLLPLSHSLTPSLFSVVTPQPLLPLILLPFPTVLTLIPHHTGLPSALETPLLHRQALPLSLLLPLLHLPRRKYILNALPPILLFMKPSL